MNILIRADSSYSIGTGHIMRDIVLAQQYHDSKIIFAVIDLPGNINDTIQSLDFSIAILKTNNVSELIDIIEREGTDLLIIDHYDIGYNEERFISEKTGIQIMSLDDTYEKHYCDILLNHNVYADEIRYIGKVPEWCDVKCGSRFTLIREEFQRQKEKESETAKSNGQRVFVAIGGTDHSNINIDILKVLNLYDKFKIDIVTTTANKNLENLKAFCKEHKNIMLHINTDEMAKLISNASFTIVSASVVLNEVIYMGKPFIAIKTADNQSEMYNYLARKNYRGLEQFSSDILDEKIKSMINFLSCELISFFDLSLKEKEMVLEWRNSPNVRKWMYNQETITLDEHLNYLKSLQAKKDRLYFLVKNEYGYYGVVDLTSIRQDVKTAELGIYVRPGLKGFGSLLMELLINFAFDVLNLQSLIAKVFENNISALNLYQKFGFQELLEETLDGNKLISLELKR